MPDHSGDIHLTLAQEHELRAVGRKRVDMADKICFSNLRAAFSTRPLSATAMGQAKLVLRQLKRCIGGLGFTMGEPVVKNLSRGRAFFGFKPTANSDPPSSALTSAQHTCERRVRVPEKLDRIIHADRDPS